MNDGWAIDPKYLYQALDEIMGTVGPVLLVLDTQADLHSGDENDRIVARQFIGITRALAIKHQCAVVLLSHPSLTGISSGTGTSGSTGWNNSVRSRLYLQKELDEDRNLTGQRILSMKKANYGPDNVELRLSYVDGCFVALDMPTPAELVEAENSGADEVCKWVLETVEAMNKNDQVLLRGKLKNELHSNTAYNTKRFGRKRIGAACDLLIKLGKLKAEQYGSPSRNQFKIICAPPEADKV